MSTENFKDKSFKTNELSKCPFTGAGTPAKFSAGRGQTVRDFWPNSLNLQGFALNNLFFRKHELYYRLLLKIFCYLFYL